jgi:hypothetical protein
VSRRDLSGYRRWVGVAILVAVAAIFSFLNSGERVTLNVGVTILYRISLVGLIFTAFLFGMVAMFLFGLRQDRRIREILRERSQRPIDPPYRPPVGYPPSSEPPP